MNDHNDSDSIQVIISDSNESTTQPSIIFGTTKPNILNVIPNYKHSNIESTISDLKRELKEQNEVNKILKSDDFEKKSEEILAFVNRNEAELDDQLNRLSQIITELKIIVTENDNLEKEEDRFNNLIESPNCIRVADKILKIKALKNDVALFLEDAGITTRSVH